MTQCGYLVQDTSTKRPSNPLLVIRVDLPQLRDGVMRCDGFPSLLRIRKTVEESHEIVRLSSRPTHLWVLCTTYHILRNSPTGFHPHPHAHPTTLPCAYLGLEI